MGKNKIGEALQKITSGQPGSPIGPEQPAQPKRIPTVKEMWTYTNSDKYDPKSNTYEPINEDTRAALVPKMMGNINWRDMDGFMGQILNQPTELDPITKAPKDPNWYKKGQVLTMDGVSQVLDLMEKAGATPESAYTHARNYLGNPAMRKRLFGENSPLTNDQFLRHWITSPGGDGLNPKTDIQNQSISGTKIEQFADRIGDLYKNLYKSRRNQFGITPQTQVSTQQAAPVQGGASGLQQNLENVVNPKLRVTKTP
jgi:hypothetical protein